MSPRGSVICVAANFLVLFPLFAIIPIVVLFIFILRSPKFCATQIMTSDSDSDKSSSDSSSNGKGKEEESLGAQIVTFFKRSVFDRRDFLPDGCIETLITEDAVMKELGITPEAKETRDPKRLLNFILEEGRKIFAILLVSRFKGEDLQKAITQFRRNKIGDASLPITEETKVDVPFFNKPKRPWDTTSIRTFCNEQWLFLAPVFSSERLNLELDANDILPFTGQGGDVKSGAFGKVYQVTVDPQHYTKPVLTVRFSDSFSRSSPPSLHSLT